MKYSLPHYKTINELLTKTLDRYSDNVIFKQRNERKEIESITANQVRKDVDQLGGWFLDNNIINKHIAILGNNSYNWLLFFLSITSSKNIALLIDPNLPSEEIKELLEYNDCEYLVFSKEYKNKALEINNFRLNKYDMEELLCLANNSNNKLKIKDIEVSEDDPAFIIFTSGTSGEKKGVILSRSNYVYASTAIAEYCSTKDSYLQILPLYHIFSLTAIFGSLFSGSTIFINSSIRFLKKDIIDSCPDAINAVPALLPHLYEILSKRENKKRVRIFCGGAPSSLSWHEKFAKIGVDLYCGYGMTETTGCISTDSELFNLKNNYMMILDGLHVYIDHPDENGIGEIMVKGPSTMRGYYNMPKKSDEAFKNGYICTGDLGKIKEGKYLMVVGRKKNIVVLPNGENISPEPIEKKLMTIDGVEECVIYEKDGTIQALIYTKKEDQGAILEDIKEMNHSSARNMSINTVTFTNTPLQKNSTGKIIRTNNKRGK